MANISSSKILYNSYRFSGANTARVEGGKGELTKDGRMGFDCSGYVDLLLKKGGYSIGNYMPTASIWVDDTVEYPALTKEAAKWQTTITDYSKVKPGDLAYFGSHVGIVVSYDPVKEMGIFRSSTLQQRHRRRGIHYKGRRQRQILG